MFQTLIRWTGIGLFALWASTVSIYPQERGKPAPSTPPPQTTPAKPFPFHGKISAIDKTAKTITLAGKQKSRIIFLTPKTRFKRAGKSTTLDDAKVGEETAGLIRISSEGRQEAISVRFGPKPSQPDKEKRAN